MNSRELKLHHTLSQFPDAARNILKSISVNGGRLSGADTKALLEIMNLKIEELMIKLLPIARIWAVAPVSAFKVGAVVRSADSLYLGANFEIEGLPLNQTIHAEQAAVMNAWHQGEAKIITLAVSAAPCGHCRQFLYELYQNQELTVIAAAHDDRHYHASALTDLLPLAFGPSDLKVDSGLMAPFEIPLRLERQAPIEDSLIVRALKAAEKSYAPYTKNYSGCAILTSKNKIFAGRYAENAAYNPGLAPLQAAIAYMNMGCSADQLEIGRAVLVEHPSKCLQKGATELFLASLAPGVSLEYYKAELIE